MTQRELDRYRSGCSIASGSGAGRLGRRPAPWHPYRDRPEPRALGVGQHSQLRVSERNGAIRDSSCTSRFTDAGVVIAIPDA
jgi:hypothetical protein